MIPCEQLNDFCTTRTDTGVQQTALLLPRFAFISHLEVAHTLQVLDGQGGFHLLDAVHHGPAYQNVRQQEACESRPKRDNRTDRNQAWRRAVSERRRAKKRAAFLSTKSRQDLQVSQIRRVSGVAYSTGAPTTTSPTMEPTVAPITGAPTTTSPKTVPTAVALTTRAPTTTSPTTVPTAVAPRTHRPRWVSPTRKWRTRGRCSA